MPYIMGGIAAVVSGCDMVRADDDKAPGLLGIVVRRWAKGKARFGNPERIKRRRLLWSTQCIGGVKLKSSL
jgi:hypothetical protein